MNHTSGCHLISIIVPVFKVEPYLNRCIESLVSQTYTNLELILVDDGSPDNCGAICDDWAAKDARIRVIHQANAGLSEARNRGIQSSTGSYLLFVDSDDYVEADYAEKLFTALIRHDADMAICGITYQYPDLHQSRKMLINEEERLISGRDALFCFEQCGSLREAYTVAWNKIYKRSFWEEIKYPKGRFYEDACVIPTLYNNCQKIVLIKDCLYVYQQREDSITGMSVIPRHVDDYLAMQKEVEKAYQKIGIKELQMLRIIHQYSAYEKFGFLSKESRAELQRKIRSIYFKKKYTANPSLGRRIKNIIAVISLPLYQKFVKIKSNFLG